jgi:hypothetical protein
MLPEQFQMDELMNAYIDWQSDSGNGEPAKFDWYAARFAAIETCFEIQPSLYAAIRFQSAPPDPSVGGLKEHLLAWLDEEPKRAAVAELYLSHALHATTDEDYKKRFQERLSMSPRIELHTLARYLRDAIAVICKAIELCRAKHYNPFLAGNYGMEGFPSPFLHQTREDQEERFGKHRYDRVHNAQMVMGPILASLYPRINSRYVSADDLYRAGHPKEAPEEVDPDYYD